MELANGMAVIDIAKEISEGLARVATSATVSYTHLDVYKRQFRKNIPKNIC